jgi:hypothetical protein
MNSDSIADLSTPLVPTIRSWVVEGIPLAEVLRRIIAYHHPQRVTTPLLMKYLTTTFGVSFKDVLLVGGWRPDGLGEITDERLEQDVRPPILNKAASWGGLP